MTEETNEPYTETIHPALDFTADHAYVGQMRRISRKERALYLIRDDGQATSEDQFDLVHHDYGLLSANLWHGPRWSDQSAEQFINKQTPAIDKKQLFSVVKEHLKKYIELSDERFYDLLALWNIGTYFFPIFNCFPYVYVGGISQSGKSKLLKICSCLSFNSILSANMSTAIIYRVIQNGRCSLFIDEAGNLQDKDRGADFREILLSGHNNGATVLRIKRTDDDFMPELFEVYGPKMIANIEGLEEVLDSRCIIIIMRRGANRQIVNREVDIKDAVWQQTRDMLYPFLMQNWSGIKRTHSDNENDTELINRDWELWKSILSLAKFFDKDTLYPRIRNLAIEKVAQNQNADSELHEYVLIEVLLPIVNKDGFYSLANIKRHMADRYENDWGLTERFVGRLLRRLGFLNSRRMGTGYEYFITLSEVKALAQSFELSEDSEASEDTTEQGNQTTKVVEDAVPK
jgi:hypothetical protein